MKTSKYDAVPVYRMILNRLVLALQKQDWTEVEKIKKELEKITNEQ